MAIYCVIDGSTALFSPQFLLDPWPEYIVDWSTVPIDLARAGYLLRLDQPIVKGLKVKHVETGRIWILTGEYDPERDMYHGHWPD